MTIARDLGISIVTGQREPGTILPSEVELAEQFHVSRSAIRESMRILTAKGLVESRQKAGTRVRDRNEWHLLDPLLHGTQACGSWIVKFVGQTSGKLA